MISIDTVYQIVQNLLRKNQQGYLSPGEFNRYADIANKARFNELYGSPESMRAGKPMREAYSENQQIDEKLSPFIVPASLTPEGNGHLTRPADLVRMISVKSVTNGKTSGANRINKNQESFVANNEIMPPTTSYIFYVDYGAYLQFYPANIGTLTLVYLSKPVDVKWNYTLDGNGRPIYDSTGTIDFQWEENETGNIVAKILEYAGKSVGDNTAVQLGAQLEVKGQ